MKKILLLSLFMLVSGQSMFAMKPEFAEAMKDNSEQPNLSQEERDELGRKLICSIHYGDVDEAMKLIEDDANINYVEVPRRASGTSDMEYPALIHAVKTWYLTLEERMVLARKLIDAGANVNLLGMGGESALLASSDPEIDELLITSGADIYQQNWAEITKLLKCANWSYIGSARLILEKATQLSQDELNSVKNWLLTNQQLCKEGRGIHKDLKRIVVSRVVTGLANDLRERVMKASGPLALKRAAEAVVINQFNGQETFDVLNQHHDINFLEQLVRNQTYEAIRTIPFMRELTEDEAFGTFNSNNQ